MNSRNLKRLERRIEKLGFGVRLLSLLPTRQIAAQLFCPCGRWKWFRLDADRPIAALKAHLDYDGIAHRG